jgi:putative PIN family toxin of toxin-antitoxin system
MTALTSGPEAGVVIDTNVALDWLVFADPGVQTLRAAVEGGRVVWWSCEATRTELAHMLSHAGLQRWAHDAPAALALHDRLARMAPAPAPAPPSLRCRDVDDQVFIDLALACEARWLLTRDRAVLALARRANSHGLQIVPPMRWLA